MATAKWSAAAAESSNIAGTALNSLADGSASGILGDIANGSTLALYVNFWLDLGSMTPGTGGSVTLRLRRKRSSTYEDATTSTIVVAKLLSSGASAKAVELSTVLTGPFTYGVEVVNNAGVSMAASGNSLVYQTFCEDVV